MAELEGYPVLYDTQVTTTGTAAAYQPGAVFVHRSGTGRSQWALAKYVRLNNDGCSKGEALLADVGTAVSYGVKTCSTTEGRQGGFFRGFAAATIASNAYGFMIFSGYCETVDLSHTAASGEALCLSGSTAGKVTPDGASSTMNATLGTSVFATAVSPVAIARTAIATGTGSCQIIGVWG